MIENKEKISSTIGLGRGERIFLVGMGLVWESKPWGSCILGPLVAFFYSVLCSGLGANVAPPLGF
jgi:hypothetical protein